jgi:myo-inositol-1(or 4)-monophosphatase
VDDLAEMLEVAERVARDAGVMLMQSRGRVSAREKAPGDLVTEADTRSQQIIARELARSFPSHTLLAEEEGVLPDPDCRWRWIVDPLDGTTNFAHGFPIWCVSIGLEHDGELVLGVVHAPTLGSTYTSARGLGLRLNGEDGRVSEVSSLRESLIVTGLPVQFAADSERQLALFGRFSTETHSVRRSGATAWNLAQVAVGSCDLCYATSALPWDVAAGVALVVEGGGIVTGLRGETFDPYNGGGLLATNGRVHAEALDAIEKVLVGLHRS